MTTASRSRRKARRGREARARSVNETDHSGNEFQNGWYVAKRTFMSARIELANEIGRVAALY